MKRLMMTAALMVAALTTATWAQAPAEHDSHHPSEGAKSAPAPTNSAPAASRSRMDAPQVDMGSMPMMGMMNNMKNMMSNMSIMNSMGMMGPGMGGMTTIDHVDGRIAFLRTELRITETQAAAWDAFADALRANAKRLGEVRASMMSMSGDPQQQTSTIADRLDLQERWLVARLEGTRAMKSAFIKLNETLSEEQRKTANNLLGPHMGMGMMAMMRSQMQPGQVRPGQMESPPTRN